VILKLYIHIQKMEKIIFFFDNFELSFTMSTEKQIEPKQPETKQPEPTQTEPNVVTPQLTEDQILANQCLSRIREMSSKMTEAEKNKAFEDSLLDEMMFTEKTKRQIAQESENKVKNIMNSSGIKVDEKTFQKNYRNSRIRNNT